MGSIKILSNDVILKIAAGEVIERPASVIKELLENSIDANSTQIKIEINEDDIKITDDGKGMPLEDLKICYIRHSTSKIINGEDLFNIKSLGFRGEALASISAVSLMKIISKTDNESCANSIIIEGGNEISIGPSPFVHNSGTSIEVKHLFFNTPARKKYLKTDKTEFRLISQIIGNYMLANPNIAFKLYNEGKLVLNSSINDSLIERYYKIYSFTAKSMIDLSSCIELEKTNLELKEKGIEIKGLISKPSVYRKTRQDEIIFVNGRLIRSSTIYSAISNAYKGYLNTGEFPLCILKIEINPSKIDVNVHPTKQEIKFEDEKLIYKAVYHTVLDVLRNTNLVRNAIFDDSILENSIQSKLKINQLDVKEKAFNNPNSTMFEDFDNHRYSSNDLSLSNKENNELNNNFKDSSLNKTKIFNEEQYVFDDIGVISDKTKSTDIQNKVNEKIKILGIYSKEFILAENITTGKLTIIDFHAAAEIRNYEILKQKYDAQNMDFQSLIEPQIIETSLYDFQIIQENEFLFKQLGFFVEEFGDNTFLLRSVPVLFGKRLEKDVLFDLIKEISQNKSLESVEKLKDKLIIRMACRASEKAGDDLNLIQAQKIVSDLFVLKENSYNCPHGRPTIVELSKEDLEKMFKRIR